MKKISVLLFSLLIPTVSLNALDNIQVKRRKKPPFYFRFPPQLNHIKGPMVMSKFEEKNDTFGKCTYKIVKHENENEFFCWCSAKKVRGYPKIYKIDPENPKIALTENKPELKFNEYAKPMIEQMNKEETKTEQKTKQKSPEASS